MTTGERVTAAGQSPVQSHVRGLIHKKKTYFWLASRRYQSAQRLIPWRLFVAAYIQQIAEHG